MASYSLENTPSLRDGVHDVFANAHAVNTSRVVRLETEVPNAETGEPELATVQAEHVMLTSQFNVSPEDLAKTGQVSLKMAAERAKTAYPIDSYRNGKTVVYAANLRVYNGTKVTLLARANGLSLNDMIGNEQGNFGFANMVVFPKSQESRLVCQRLARFVGNHGENGDPDMRIHKHGKSTIRHEYDNYIDVYASDNEHSDDEHSDDEHNGNGGKKKKKTNGKDNGNGTDSSLTNNMAIESFRKTVCTHPTQSDYSIVTESDHDLFHEIYADAEDSDQISASTVGKTVQVTLPTKMLDEYCNNYASDLSQHLILADAMNFGVTLRTHGPAAASMHKQTVDAIMSDDDATVREHSGAYTAMEIMKSKTKRPVSVCLELLMRPLEYTTVADAKAAYPGKAKVKAKAKTDAKPSKKASKKN